MDSRKTEENANNYMRIPDVDYPQMLLKTIMDLANELQGCLQLLRHTPKRSLTKRHREFRNKYEELFTKFNDLNRDISGRIG